MKNKKGFVFVETIIVIVTVLAGLMLIYISYTNMVRNERRRVRYDEPSFIYKTYAVGKFLLSFYDDDGYSVLYKKANEYSKQNSEVYYVSIAPNDIDFFSSAYSEGKINSERKEFYNSMLSNLHIQNVLIISKEKIDYIYNNKNDAKIRNLIPHNLLYYILSIKTDGDSDDQCYLIVEFAEKVNGDECSPNQLASAETSSTTNKSLESSCTFYYGNMKIIKEGV